MEKKRSVIFSVLVLFSIIGANDVYAHSMFNSAEKFDSGYRVQVATAPEFPQINEPSQFMIRVTEGFDYEEVDRFTMGIKIFYNEKQVDAIPPKSIEGSHWDFDYVWRNSGNHIVELYLYDMPNNPEVITYKFNMGTQSPFGYIFFAAITVGALSLTGVVLYIYVPKIFGKSKP
ncbi:hypothetical protein [Nitrosopumilus piranensis]|uniref:Uncharacterized protein n=1 Tax=Nitrosopumilus piranensis TaxID=1582439 RepID=A0A0C5BPW5_9ARCH|nr:hypothetical protein [Nitrosopumilus piranensis]AJM91748.1 conserved exported protein of unknown function [Nitrosopumilus piranensis]